MIIKFILIAVVCAVLCVIVKQYRSDISIILQISGIIAIVIFAISYFDELKNQVEEIGNFSALIEDDYIKMLIKILGIAIAAKLGADICNDTGNSALSEGVDIIGKVIILAMCMPLVKILVQIAEGLLT